LHWNPQRASSIRKLIKQNEFVSTGSERPENGRRFFTGIRAFDWLAWAAVCLAVLFAAYQWVYSGGFPYIKDGNETAMSYVHALNLYNYNPFATRFLTSTDTDFTKKATDARQVYTHNPNFPRYVHYILLLLGLKSFTAQVLLIIIVMTLVNMLALRRLLLTLLGNGSYGGWLALVAMFGTLTDYIGFLAYTVNTYRTYVFCLLWLSLFLVIRPGKRWQLFAVVFMAFQLEYGFAIFVLVSTIALLLMHGGPRKLGLAAAALGGAAASMLVFLVQLITYLPYTYIWQEFGRTSHRRGGAGFLSYFTTTLPGWGAKIQAVNSPALNAMLCWALATSIVICVRARTQARAPGEGASARLALASLYLSLTIGAVASSAALTDYFLDAFFGSLLPFMTFFNATAMALVASDLYELVRRISWGGRPLRIAAGAAIGMLVLWPMARQSLRWWHDYPGLSGGYIDVLKKHYHKKPILVMGHFTYIPTAITEGRALWMSGEEVDIANADFSRFDEFRDEKGELVFLCLDLQWVGCAALTRHLEAAGNEVLYQGRDFAFVGLKGKPRGAAAAAKASGNGSP